MIVTRLNALNTARAPLGRPPRGHKEQGFGLLEAIVALVLISIAVMAAYSWINTNIITLGRIQNVAEQTEARNNIRTYLENINPMQTPDGSARFAGYQILWESKLIAPEQDQVNSVRGTGLYKVGLYQMQINVTKNNAGQPWFAFDLTQVGYLKVRDDKMFLR